MEPTPEKTPSIAVRINLNARLNRLAVGVSTEIDPVCKKSIFSHRITSEYDGETYYFCSPACKTKFDAAPEQYLS